MKIFKKIYWKLFIPVSDIIVDSNVDLELLGSQPCINLVSGQSKTEFILSRINNFITADSIHEAPQACYGTEFNKAGQNCNLICFAKIRLLNRDLFIHY